MTPNQTVAVNMPAAPQRLRGWTQKELAAKLG